MNANNANDVVALAAPVALTDGGDPRASGEKRGKAEAPSGKNLRGRIIDALQRIYDPEIPVNIYDLGLIYDIQLLPLGRINVAMTLTSPACPVAGSLPGQVEAALRRVEGVQDAAVELVWEPPWDMDRMSDETKLELNLL
ncbi:MAG: DUF59 domain-containing protein [Deltaproteobacteria bacterium]|nr:DUF59 domain-containing protein [Deltaproteobacteria bacterium]